MIYDRSWRLILKKRGMQYVVVNECWNDDLHHLIDSVDTDLRFRVARLHEVTKAYTKRSSSRHRVYLIQTSGMKVPVWGVKDLYYEL